MPIRICRAHASVMRFALRNDVEIYCLVCGDKGSGETVRGRRVARVKDFFFPRRTHIVPHIKTSL